MAFDESIGEDFRCAVGVIFYRRNEVLTSDFCSDISSVEGIWTELDPHILGLLGCDHIHSVAFYWTL